MRGRKMPELLRFFSCARQQDGVTNSTKALKIKDFLKIKRLGGRFPFTERLFRRPLSDELHEKCTACQKTAGQAESNLHYIHKLLRFL